MAVSLVQESQEKIAQEIEFIPQLDGELATAATEVKISVDAARGRWRWRRQSRDLETAELDRRGQRVKRNFQIFSPWVFISRPCRCDRVEQLGGTEMQNRKRFLQLGVTEKFKLVASRLKLGST